MVQIPGSRWDKGHDLWKVPLTWAACLQLRGSFGPDLTIGENLQHWAWNERDTRIQPVTDLREALKLDPYHPLDKFIDGIEKSSDSMGSGKTVTLIRTIQLLMELNCDPLPVVIICPNSLKHTVWERELARWAPELKVSVVDGSASVRRKQLLPGEAAVYIINWDSVRLHSRLAPYGSVRLTDKQKEPKELNALEPRTVILDEAHRLRSVGSRQVTEEDGSTHTVPQSQQVLAAWAVTHQAEYRYALTGTPVNNHVGDLFGLLHAIEPTWFPAKTKYLDRYAEKSFGLWGGIEILGLKAQNEAEFRAVTEPLYRRIPKEVSLPQLPPKLPPMIRETPMTPKQAKAYQQMEATLLAMLNELLVAPNPLSQLTRLSQFAAASAEITGRREDGSAIIELTAPSAKVDDLVDLLEELGDEPLAVTAVSRQLLELASVRLTKEKITHGMVTGAQAPFERGQAIEAFQQGKKRVILFTLGAGAEGITLTRANHLLFMQKDFSPLLNAQAEDRVHRIGSEIHDFVQVIEQRTPGTVEERKTDVLRGKEDRIEEVIRDREILKRLLGG
jgi:SNF2 family DNA or RNA helicase